MDRRSGQTAFEGVHLVVPAVYFVGTIGLGIFVLQPVYVLLSVVGALLFGGCCRGWRAVGRSLAWQAPLVMLVCLVNPLFSRSGATILAWLGPLPLKLEPLAFGACMGGMLVSMLQWVSNATCVLTQDRVMGMAGRRLPVVGTMVSMAVQLLPQLLRRHALVASALDACTASGGGGQPSASGRARLGSYVRSSTMLMSWAMEDSLERSDAMRARGWGATSARSHYRTELLRSRDVLYASALAAMVGANVVLAIVAVGEWRFYPQLPTLEPWGGYAPYAVLMALPSVLALAERLRWNRLG